MSDGLIRPDWPAPKNVHAFISTREGGESKGPYSSMNLGDHVDDDPCSVAANRASFAQSVGLDKNKVFWLKQVHGVSVIDLDRKDVCSEPPMEADASTCTKPLVGCVIMTADCMPVLFCDASGSRVAAVHAGWRGLEQGVIQQALSFFEHPHEVMAYIGPAISQKHFEVGEEVKAVFELRNPEYASAFIDAGCDDAGTRKYRCDLYDIARKLLQSAGVTQIYGGDFCTYAQEDQFYSFRRDGKHSGRMASLIYLS